MVEESGGGEGKRLRKVEGGKEIWLMKVEEGKGKRLKKVEGGMEIWLKKVEEGRRKD